MWINKSRDLAQILEADFSLQWSFLPLDFPSPRYPSVSCEILTSDVTQINDALGEDESLLRRLYSFLQTGGILNPLLASFFSKVMGILINRKTDQVASHMVFSLLKPHPFHLFYQSLFVLHGHLNGFSVPSRYLTSQHTLCSPLDLGRSWWNPGKLISLMNILLWKIS